MTYKNYLHTNIAILIFLALIKLVIPFIISSDFGLHRDEFLYWAMRDHLDWGFLEVPPSIAFFAKIAYMILGQSISAIRFFPALSGALILLLTGLITRELSGGRYAQILAVLAYLSSPIYLRINYLYY